jgi:YfiH family protein
VSGVEGFLRAPGLAAAGVPHGFGLRGVAAPPAARRARQVHGARVARIDPRRPEAELGEADAVLSTLAEAPAAVVTADCVPVLLASADGRAVAAVHGGWRGLAAGVVEAAAAALAQVAPEGPPRAAVGPHIGPCCYEVDAPVWDALRPRFGEALDAALAPTRPGHARLDLARLARRALEAAGVPASRVEVLCGTCTRCDAVRFESARRDGPRAGRLVHWIAPRPAAGA